MAHVPTFRQCDISAVRGELYVKADESREVTLLAPDARRNKNKITIPACVNPGSETRNLSLDVSAKGAKIFDEMVQRFEADVVAAAKRLMDMLDKISDGKFTLDEEPKSNKKSKKGDEDADATEDSEDTADSDLEDEDAQDVVDEEDQDEDTETDEDTDGDDVTADTTSSYETSNQFAPSSY